jgi:putative DNA primase/helicase
MTTNAHNLEAALRYAALGWKVFPIAAGAKVPKAGTHGHRDATTDGDTIRGWFAGKPHLNVGMATGQASGVWVLDEG